jgi:hypothetical protein
MLDKIKPTRIAGLHVSDARPVVNEPVIIAGYLQWYDLAMRQWEPLKDKIKLIIDGKEVEELRTDYSGRFSFEYAFTIGEHVIEARYDGKVKYDGTLEYDFCKSMLTVKTITEGQRKELERIIRLVFAGAGLLIATVMIVSILLILLR